jgi:hypothetical protein
MAHLISKLILSTTVLSASTPKMVETQQEIHRLTKENYTLKSEITNASPTEYGLKLIL